MIQLLIALGLLAGNAFFVGAEFALVSARRTQLEPRAEAGSQRARVTLRAMEQVSLMMACAQLGITLCSLGLGAVAEPLLAHWLEVPFAALGVPAGLLHPLAFILALAIVVYFHMVLGEMVPKNLALAGPDRVALALGPVLYGIVRLLKPAMLVLNATANGIVRLCRITPQDEVSSTYTRDEVAALVAESRQEGLLAPTEHQLITGALSLPERTVRSVLLPLEQLATVPEHTTAAEVEGSATRTGFSRFPIATDAGGLLGYLHLKDVLDDEHTQPHQPIPSARLRPLPTFSATTPLHQALSHMRQHSAHLAQVVAEEGTVLGVITLEDVLEELVGDIRDATQRTITDTRG
ncbi:CBS domain containing-hemolysin-like protein [Saccharopolyspora lacisalsi]|uniref:CBS domain containing-hemolysin-like protein n=1 Tax=Halosaccharopolyspora lacisalsi TaxID=1000566 RepID=A0A839DUA4_9PSEU|nr:hemolysin family protein [Halosaccharopolyspora lacisalsi]MBA8823856.1 CBS domain containing-hemolysin-like protein [Halosaccharopolyspora lacisalsi]